MELKIAARTITDEAGNPRHYHYTLLVEPIETGQLVCESYGVQVREEHGDWAQVPNITTSALRIDELLTLLVDHAVGPAALADVVSDWL